MVRAPLRWHPSAEWGRPNSLSLENTAHGEEHRHNSTGLQGPWPVARISTALWEPYSAIHEENANQSGNSVSTFLRVLKASLRPDTYEKARSRPVSRTHARKLDRRQDTERRESTEGRTEMRTRTTTSKTSLVHRLIGYRADTRRNSYSRWRVMWSGQARHSAGMNPMS